MTDLEHIIKILKNGGVVIFPTDTVFGIGCRIDDERAVRRIFEIKKRDLGNALLVLVDSVEMAEKYVDIPEEVRQKLVNKYWPGGLTIFFKTKPGKVPGIVTAKSNILAVRWPDHKTVKQVISAVGVPIIATSANISGEKTPYTLKDVDQEVVEQADTVLKGECTLKKESTIVDTTVFPWEKIREGAVTVEL